MSGLRRWLAERAPSPPEALPLSVEDASGDPAEILTDAGMRALEMALSGQGERRGAYDLLTADALLTYACESSTAAADPEAPLLRILERMGRPSG